MTKEKIWLGIYSLIIVGIFYFAYSTVDSKNCSDFSTWKDAQEYYNSHTNWISKDQSKLDANHNGFVCESLFKRNPGVDVSLD